MVHVRIRPPVPADGLGIGAVHVRAWRVGYAGLMPSEFLGGLDESERGRAWEQRLIAHVTANPDDIEFLIAEIPDDPDPQPLVAGVATLGPERTEGRPAGPQRRIGEVWMINVLPETWGRGVGSRLLDAAATRLGERGYDRAVLWVLEGNDRARAFYEHNGWRHDGTSKVETFGGVQLRELRYARALDR